jgi:hypothetical protein
MLTAGERTRRGAVVRTTAGAAETAATPFVVLHSNAEGRSRRQHLAAAL